MRKYLTLKANVIGYQVCPCNQREYLTEVVGCVLSDDIFLRGSATFHRCPDPLCAYYKPPGWFLETRLRTWLQV